MSLTDYTLNALILVMWWSLPAIIAATAVGLLVGLLQALTQIQDQTLPHGLKLIAVVIALVATGYWMSNSLIDFTVSAFTDFVSF